MERPSKKRRANESLAVQADGATDSSTARQPTTFDAEMMQQQLELFVRSGNVDSAQILGDFLISVAPLPTSHSRARMGPNALLMRKLNGHVEPASTELPPTFHAKTVRLFADLMFAKCEFKRAIRYYRYSCGDKLDLTNEENVETFLKLARCHLQLDCVHEAINAWRLTKYFINQLKVIPLKTRSLSINLLLGKLYVKEGLQNQAEECYTEALRQNPYALEAALALTELAVAKDASPEAFSGSVGTVKASENSQTTADSDAVQQHNIERFYTQPAAATKSSAKVPSPVDLHWMQAFVTAHMDAGRGNYRTAIESFNALDQIFPNNLYCLLRKGALEVDLELLHPARITFNRTRQMDDLNMAFMDCYANCLRKGESHTNLNALMQELFRISTSCTESWLAAAYYNDVKGDYEKALQFCERAIELRNRHAPAHLLQGQVLLRLHRPQPALKSFWAACRLNRSLEAYTGIITSYCDLFAIGVNRYKEAFATAKSIVKLYPQKAQSFVLLGSVLALSSEHREQARQALVKALSIEPRKLSTSFALADLLVEEGNIRGAIDRLLALGERYPREEVFTKLAYAYSMDKQYAEALKYFHEALRLSPDSTEALRGLDRLEKLMRGEDPDELNNSMEQIDPVEREESMDASGYLTP